MTNTQATDHSHVELTPGANTAVGVAVSWEEDGISSYLCLLFSLPLLLVQGLACGAQENLSSKLWNWVKRRPLGVWLMLEKIVEVVMRGRL
ncbi:hypothetical protein PILCRDRAFT_824153 [Piloderma croceum F 1598]|uniref:Uncharacterized protein n=1 Tax=Piloderma croceum (strain F 1598) TaxID=765440 RepID=A0A0C3AXG9_PILCF|nr:hypothetical protein PILCRDRAFT_824153 [Piloderma croceum F 1598]